MFGGQEQKHALTLFTDAYVITGHVVSSQRRVTDILNAADSEFLVLTDVVTDEYSSRSGAVRADFAQVNLASVLFAISTSGVETTSDLRTPKIPEEALISIPPFKIAGRIHLMPEANLSDALRELRGRFIPVTDATYWSDTLGEARTTAELVAFNHSRAQILAPHRAVDPWAGLGGDQSAGGGGSNPPEPPGGGWG